MTENLPSNQKNEFNLVVAEGIEVKTNFLPTSTRQMIQARYESPRVNQADHKFIVTKVTQAVIKCYVFENRKIEETIEFQTQIQELVQMVIDEIKNEFSSLTVDEVCLAIHMGVRGKFGEYYGLAPKSFYKFVSSYNEMIKSDRLFIDTVKKIEEERLDKNTIKEPLEVVSLKNRITFIESLISDLNAIQNGSAIAYKRICPLYYDFLDGHKLITVTRHDKDEFIKKAVEELRKEDFKTSVGWDKFVSAWNAANDMQPENLDANEKKKQDNAKQKVYTKAKELIFLHRMNVRKTKNTIFELVQSIEDIKNQLHQELHEYKGKSE